ncbi:unnamed protein product [Rodentolepis nana]|uniref:Uncharacterized protein n=1 Tax=Rodentolepis nana TaxID=102285 RepID=A0A0R3T722_RODNA|nr:unnamed protein product [Rodentolepis nana]
MIVKTKLEMSGITREILEPGDFTVDVFIVVVDGTLTGEAAVSQQKFLKKALTELRKRRIPFVFASSKRDCEVSPENKEFLKHLLHKVCKSLKKTRCCRVETSARLNINVHQAFFSAALLCTPSSSEITCKYFPCYRPLNVVFKASRGYQWLEEIENPQFSVPSTTFSCTCPRRLLVHSVFECRRTHLMSSLRREATSVHSLLPPSVHSLALGADADKPSNPYWPHRTLALLSKSLCNQAVPLTPKNATPKNSVRVGIRICEREEGNEEVSKNCISQLALTQKNEERRKCLQFELRNIIPIHTSWMLIVLGRT